jgi:hypothetical protein
MSKRTEDLALQARNRAQAEQRQAGQSRQGNSDAAEAPSALKREQDRKALERSQQQFPGNENFRGLDQAEARARQEAEERQRQASNVPGRTDAQGRPAVQGQGSDAQLLNETVLRTPAPLHTMMQGIHRTLCRPSPQISRRRLR